jgi:RimJ/RimL family protein N-acetyltransferase
MTGSSEAPVINITGELVALGPMRRDLLPVYERWINDFGTMRTLAVPPVPVTTDAEAAWFDRQATSGDSLFTIYERETWRPIGNTGLHRIDYRHRTATFGIMIGEPESRGKGYGTETARLMLDYAFTALGLHNVMLTVYEFNLAARRAYQKAGFREMGRRRSAKLMGGRYWDEIFMDCIAQEFESPLLQTIFRPDEPRSSK